jgi:NADH dehydrogenase (ubiquinone) 1 beta subcomplex subunit 8
MMNSIILRRVAARSVARHRSLTSTNILRSYATSSEEPDPQLDGYPQLPWQSRQSLPPLGWHDNLTRRNFGDTVRLSPLDFFSNCY